MDGETSESDELFVPVDVPIGPPPEGLAVPQFFPPPTATTADGLLCVGGRLSPEWLLDAYRHGIFPWPMWADDPTAWWSPDPRAVIELDGLHVARRLRRTIRSGKFTVSCDRDFRGVILGCATAGDRTDNTWLMPNMVAAYCRLHELGHAHSVEVWQDGVLAGGTYGVTIGALFAAESMFHRVTDASKVAVAALVAHLRVRSYELLDIQQWTPHTGSLGATQIARTEYLQRLAQAVNRSVTFGEYLQGDP
ncbi:MAG TPA: leucyl/phenylalanyl-tRNA--protein transferase [Lacipirellulaceae bacterium]|jgi:leucyl/phenylalanyl-tRNA--protein transferase|nr:leucyl/phenylalanyl-tRNA--protein transferase [Lacipirellulaceae bacterium]